MRAAKNNPVFHPRPSASIRVHLRLISTLPLLIAFSLAAAETPPPITTLKSPAGDLLRKWFAEGTAAGNVGDWYDNRDRTHSELNRTPFPQLQKHVYSEDELKFRRDWAARGTVLPKVAFGNSSTSAPSSTGGSNPRMMYNHPKGLAALYAQYTKNNLYMYPEHQDHDPGHNGIPANAYGDLYPTNTPYLIISQGSSGSDQPFMRALPQTLAAFRPDVKKKLIESGLLMPTIQMIFRSSNKQLKYPAQYLTGLAHPPVFEGSWVDDLKMVEAAHAIQLDNIPPMVQLKSIEEDKAVPGVDYFEDDETEKHADTPCVIARIFRGSGQTRRMVVSAEDSYDLNKRPLTFTWAVLRGDASRIKINYLNDAHSKAELIVPFHQRRPDEHDPKIDTQRVDIGIFANNGAYNSAPAFVTWFFFDNEARTYDLAGRILEISYGNGESIITVTDWPALLDMLAAGKSTPPDNILNAEFKPELRPAFERAAADFRVAQTRQIAAQQKKKETESERNKLNEKLKARPPAEIPAVEREAKQRLDSEFQTADKAFQAADKELKEVTTAKREGLPQALQPLLAATFQRLITAPDFLQQHKAGLEALAVTDKKIEAALDFAIHFSPRDQITVHAATQRQKINADTLREIFPKLISAKHLINFADPQLTAPKRWRDSYHYDDNGTPIGWTRYDESDATSYFTADGHRVVEMDAQGRCAKAQSVKYVRDVDLKKGFAELWKPLKQVAGSEFYFYAYADEKGRRGKIERTEKITPPAEQKSETKK